MATVNKCGRVVTSYRRLRNWYSCYLGTMLQEAEVQQLDAILPNLFGYHLLQLGDMHSIALTGSSRIPHCMVMDADSEYRHACSLYGEHESLPIATDCLDVLVLPHTLEFSPNPHQILREADRILIPEGHVIIVGFNPWSVWGLWRFVARYFGKPPWCGRFLGMSRMKDWLLLLGFDIVESIKFFYRPPIQNAGMLARLKFMEKFCQRYCKGIGAVYIVLAKKRVIPLTPVRSRWRATGKLLPTGAAEPTSRIRHDV